MSDYAITDAGELIVSWSVGTGRHAETVCRLVRADEPALALSEALSALSHQCWRVYTDPLTSPDDMGRIEDDRERLPKLADIAAAPNLPDEHGGILSSYIAVEEAAHRVGRALRRLDHAETMTEILADIRSETAAVINADLGDLSGRARQAVMLSRAQASPVQVAAAHDTIAADPLHPAQLFTQVDPTAASVAAAEWFQAAIGTAADESGVAPNRVIHVADDIDAIPVPTLEVVLRLLESADAQTVVPRLVQDALTMASGRLPDFDGVQEGMRRIRELAEQEPDGRDAILAQFRICVLDAQRPAPDLLEDLLTGIYAAWLVWDAYAVADEEEDADRDDDDDFDDGGRESSGAASQAEFVDLLREAMSRG
jgi:hypothetical protein